MLLVVCQLSRDVIGYEDSKYHWCVFRSVCCDSLTIVYCQSKLSVVQSFWPGLLEAWLVLTSVKYHGNLYILYLLTNG